MKGYSGNKKKKILDSRGSVTPMVAIILAAVLLLNFLLIDGLRVLSFKNTAKRLNDYSSYSIMSFFDKTLEEQYGLYGLDSENKEELENTYYGMLTKGVTTEKGSSNELFYSNIMNGALADYSVELSESLSEVDVLAEQITATQRYESIFNIVDFVADKVEQVVKLENKISVLADTSAIDELYETFTAKKSELSLKINGTGDIALDGVNGFFNAPVFHLSDSEIMGYSVDGDIVYDEEQGKLLDMALRNYLIYVYGYKDYNLEAINLCDEIQKIQEEAQIEMSSMNQKLQLMDAEEKKTYGELIQKNQEEIMSLDVSYIKEIVSKNYDLFTKAQNKYEKLSVKLQNNEKVSIEEIKAVIEAADKAYGDYSKVELKTQNTTAYELQTVELSGAKDTEALANKFFNAGKKTISDELYEKIPSAENARGADLLTNYAKDLGSLNTLEAVKNCMTGCGNFASVLEGVLADSTEPLLLDDYILTYFNSAADTSLDDKHYLAGEIEYIIGGMQSDKENASLVYSELLLMRTGLNAAYLMTDSEKKSEVDAMATALSALTEGYGKDIYFTIIIVAWSSVEAVSDLTLLECGEEVPIWKQKGDWVTSLDGEPLTPVSGENEDEKENLTALGYEEYLRILLLNVSKTTKLYRIQDIIELNLYKQSGTYKSLGDYYTKAECSGTFNLKTICLINKKGKREYVREVESEGTY